jgi:hypothetical protein
MEFLLYFIIVLRQGDQMFGAEDRIGQTSMFLVGWLFALLFNPEDA